MIIIPKDKADQVRRERVEAAAKAVKTYSRWKIKEKLEGLGLYGQFKAILTQAGRWDDFIIPNDLSESEGKFMQMKDQIAAALGLDADTFLDGCEME